MHYFAKDRRWSINSSMITASSSVSRRCAPYSRFPEAAIANGFVENRAKGTSDESDSNNKCVVSLWTLGVYTGARRFGKPLRRRVCKCLRKPLLASWRNSGWNLGRSRSTKLPRIRNTATLLQIMYWIRSSPPTLQIRCGWRTLHMVRPANKFHYLEKSYLSMFGMHVEFFLQACPSSAMRRSEPKRRWLADTGKVT